MDIYSGLLTAVYIVQKQSGKARLFRPLSTVSARFGAGLSPKAVGRSVDNVGKGGKEPHFTGAGGNRSFFDQNVFIALKQ